MDSSTRMDGVVVGGEGVVGKRGRQASQNGLFPPYSDKFVVNSEIIFRLLVFLFVPNIKK